MVKQSYPSDMNETFKQAEWNSGLASAMRLHTWLQESNLNDYGGNTIERYKCLAIFYREIKPKLSNKEKEEGDKLKNAIEKEVENVTDPRTKGRMISTTIYVKLDEFEDKIRKYADAHGLMNPNKGTIYDDM